MKVTLSMIKMIMVLTYFICTCTLHNANDNDCIINVLQIDQTISRLKVAINEKTTHTRESVVSNTAIMIVRNQSSESTF